MSEIEGNSIQRVVQRGVEITKPIDIAVLAGGVIFSSGTLVAAGAIGLVGGEIVKSFAKPKKKG